MTPATFDLREGPTGAPGLVLHVSGELDMATGPVLRARLERALKAGVREMVVDLSGVSFIDSISLAALVAVKHRLGPDGRLAIVTHGAFVGLMFEATGLDGVLDVFTDDRAARDFAFG